MTVVIGSLFWAFVHVFFLIGSRNRLVVAMDWGSAYFTFERYARIAIPEPDPRVARVVRAGTQDRAAEETPRHHG